MAQGNGLEESLKMPPRLREIQGEELMEQEGGNVRL